MLKLNASYSKKIPVAGEQFSSQSYHCSVEVELSDAASPEQLQSKIQGTFALVRDAVEAELLGKPAMKPEKAEPSASPAPSAQPTPPKPDATAKASNKQVRFILDLAKAKGMGLSDLTGQVQRKFKAESVYDLTRKDASKLLDDLKAAA
jgi:hypothetical protein